MPDMSDTTIITSGDMPDLDAMAAAGREKAKETYPFKYVGKTWHARTAVPFGKLVESITGEMDLDKALTMVVQFIVEDEREQFRADILASEDVTTSELGMLSTFFNEKAQEATGNADS